MSPFLECNYCAFVKAWLKEGKKLSDTDRYGIAFHLGADHHLKPYEVKP